MVIKKILKRLFGFKSELASLTIVGVGPGDPSLLTISALNAIQKAEVIIFPISSDDKKGVAAEIVKEHIKFKRKIPIIFPMARKGYDPHEIWSNAADIILKFLKNEESVALICLGDTSLFASSSNILRIIKNNHPEIITKTIPGISSISAAAALSNFDLAKKGETLIIQECPSSKLELLDLIDLNKNNRNVLVLMKVGNRWVWVKDVLKKEEILDKSLLAINVGMNSQFVENASKYNNDMIPYLSIILIRF